MILLRIFKNNRSGGVAGLIILSLAVFIHSFVFQAEALSHTGMPFYGMIFGAIHTTPVLNRIVTLILIWILSYMLIRIGGRYVLLNFRSFMPGIFFLLFTMAVPHAQQVTPALVGSIFYLLCFAILFDVHDNPPDTFSVFIASLVLVLGSMFYLKLIWFVPLIWISLATLRTVTWRELFYPVVAFLLLGIFLITWYWVVMDDGQLFVGLLRENLAFERSFATYHYSVYLFYGFLLLLVLVASIYMGNRFQARKTVIQNIYQVLFYMFVAGLIFFLLIAKADAGSLAFIAFPVSYILSNYFHRKKNSWVHELVLWIALGLLVFVQVSSG